MSIFYQVARKFVWKGILGLLIFMLTACGTGSSTNSTGTSNATATKKTLALSTGKISEFPVPTAHGEPLAVTSGPDGNLWFTDFKRGQDQSQADQSLIGRITPGGKVKEFLLPTTNTLPTGITKGPDGNLWFTESADINSGSMSTYFGKVGYITPGGRINEFLLPAANSDPLMITSGPDGNLWFTDAGTNQIGRISPAGKLTEFPIPTANSLPTGITSGPDGNLWFTEAAKGKIGRISLTGAIKEFSLSKANSNPEMITSGPDGNLWFTETIWAGPNINGEIGRITPAGEITIFSLPNSKSYSQGGGGYLYGIVSGPAAITSGPDGNLWFTDLPGKIGHISSNGKNITEFSILTANNDSYGITSNPGGNLWFTEDVGKIGQIEFRHE